MKKFLRIFVYPVYLPAVVIGPWWAFVRFVLKWDMSRLSSLGILLFAMVYISGVLISLWREIPSQQKREEQLHKSAIAWGKTFVIIIAVQFVLAILLGISAILAVR